MQVYVVFAVLGDKTVRISLLSSASEKQFRQFAERFLATNPSPAIIGYKLLPGTMVVEDKAITHLVKKLDEAVITRMRVQINAHLRPNQKAIRPAFGDSKEGVTFALSEDQMPQGFHRLSEVLERIGQPQALAS